MVALLSVATLEFLAVGTRHPCGHYTLEQRRNSVWINVAT